MVLAFVYVTKSQIGHCTLYLCSKVSDWSLYIVMCNIASDWSLYIVYV